VIAKNENEADERMRVLIIDDELGPRESLRMVLNREYAVFCAASVDEGIELLKSETPDVVIMDIRMPGKNGIEGLREVREIDQNAEVIMLTGYGALETAQEAIRLGANDYINKPFDTRDMRLLVQQHSRKARTERRRVLMLKELQDMNSRLMEDIADKDRLATLGQSSAEFAHDLRNPLMIVRGYTDLLTQQLDRAKEMMGGEFDQVSQYLGVIEQNVRRCCDLASMWQRIGKADTGEFQPVPVSQVVEDVVVSVEPLITAVGVEVEYRLDAGDVVINGSRPQLLRAIHNIISNAIDAVDEVRGRIVFTCERKGSQVHMRVEDNGSGMPPDVLERMFEPYFTTKANGKGTGLGTVIARRIIEEHDGSVAVESHPGQGTFVSIDLPISASVEAVPA